MLRSRRHLEGTAIKGIKTVAGLLLCATLVLGATSLGIAGEQRTAPIKRYDGQIGSIKLDRCRL